MAKKYEVISGDGYLEVRPSVWAGSLGAEYAEKLLEPDATAGNTLAPMDLRRDALAEQAHKPVFSSGEPRQRLREQDADGIDAEVLFPPAYLSAFSPRKANDSKAYLDIVRAYNNFLAQDFCAAAPDRLIGVGFIPLTGVDDSVEELKRCCKLGLPAVLLRKWPNGSARYQADDDKFFAAAIDSGMKICLQEGIPADLAELGSEGSYKKIDPATGYAEKAAPEPVVGNAGLTARAMTRLSFGGSGVPAMTLAQLIGLGLFDVFPKLKFYFTNSQASWIAHYLHMSDERYQRMYPFSGYRLKKMPSQYVRDHCRFCFVKDTPAVAMRYDIGLDLLMWGSHYPHWSGTAPNSRRFLDELFRDVPPHEKHRILVQNPCEFFGLDAEKILTATH